MLQFLKDYVRNKQKLSECIHYTQKWQVLLVIFSYVAFTCDIILVLTLIVFFIRYQKTMQAMLMAFITTNMSNSGIPSAKANPISRTSPPLFMIKISEEDRITEDLHKIKSMQLIVQVIMIIVCVMIPRFEEEPNRITAHSMPPTRRQGGVNSNTILQISSTERLWQCTGYEA